jgi:hypothetical protein
MTRVEPVTSSSSGHNARYIPPTVPEVGNPLQKATDPNIDRNRSNDLL